MSYISTISTPIMSPLATPSKPIDPEREAASGLTTLLLDAWFKEGLTGATANKSSSQGETMFRQVLSQYLAESCVGKIGEDLTNQIMHDLGRNRRGVLV
jgi:hypothetical protein